MPGEPEGFTTVHDSHYIAGNPGGIGQTYIFMIKLFNKIYIFVNHLAGYITSNAYF
ncbi:hypothetical protein [Nostoc sp.]|uniref:hypothetical protein n=1 Tax=Nostoc sp. TaxID=1180 RepID=UPI002FF5DA33